MAACNKQQMQQACLKVSSNVMLDVLAFGFRCKGFAYAAAYTFVHRIKHHYVNDRYLLNPERAVSIMVACGLTGCTRDEHLYVGQPFHPAAS
jgi:hypothetical protein